MTAGAPTTPKALYESLFSNTQRLHHEPKPVPNDVLDFLATLGHKIEKTDGSTFELISDIPKLIAERHSKELEELVTNEEFFYIGPLDLPEVNAESKAAPNGGLLILVNSGLPTFLYEIARAISTRYEFQDTDGNKPYGESVPDFEETCRWIAEIFTWYKKFRRPTGFHIPAHPAQRMLASNLASHAEQFVVSHEIAHFTAGHIDTPFNGRKYMTPLPSSVPSSRWEQELEADQVGLRILFGNSDRALRDEQLDAYTGADFFLQVMSLYEELAGTPPSETHPPSKLRLERLRDYARSLCVNDRARSQLFWHAKSLEFLFGEVRETILKPSSLQLERARQIANMVREKFEQLLEACANRRIPDYHGFNNEVTLMFSKYPSFTVCSAIASSMDKIERHLQAIHEQDPSQRDWNTYRLIYHKLKLLIFFLDITPLPQGVKEAIESKRKTRVFKP